MEFYSDSKQYLETLKTKPTEELLDWVDSISGDPKYQTIEIDGVNIRQGYMRSHRQWEQIQELGIDWTNKSVIDLGCFNGYFSFKVEEAGAQSVNGFDCDTVANKIAERIKLIKKSKCVFHLVNLAKNPEMIQKQNVDVILLLNCFHHVANETQDQGTNLIECICKTCNQLILTVDPLHNDFVQETVLTNNFTLVQKQNTHPTKKEGPRQYHTYHPGIGKQ